jgi:cobalt-zinc-cadmium efflux system outer membrane protein
MLELRRTVLAAMRASVEAAESLRQAGNITDLDLATDRQFLEQARVAFARAETEASATRERLSAMLGLWGTKNIWAAPARLPDPPASELSTDTLEQRAVERSVDLAMARARYAAAAKRANLARAEGWLPELKAGVSAQREGSWSVGPAAEIQVPLLYQGQGQVDAALAEARRQEHVHEDLAVHVRSAARTAATKLRSARESAMHYRSVVLPLGDQILGETQLQYNAMGIGVFQLLQTKREQVEAARTYVELLRDYWVARTEVARLEAGRVNRTDLGADQLIRESTPLERGRGGLEQH